MNKPNNYESTQTGGDFVPVEFGGHYAIIKNVSERETKNGDPMVVVSIDFDKKDDQAGYFTDMFKKDDRPDKKYPNQAVNYITSEYKGECTRGFKSFLKAYADSNGLDVNKDIKWGEDFCKQFKNKRIGVVYGGVEEEYNGEVKMRRKIRWFCDYKKVEEQKTPDVKYFDNPAAQVTSKPTVDSNGFMNVPEGSDDEIPFD